MPRASVRYAALPERVAENMKKDRSRLCGYCRTRSAKVGDLCCACHDDPEAREQYAAWCAAEGL